MRTMVFAAVSLLNVIACGKVNAVADAMTIGQGDDAAAIDGSAPAQFSSCVGLPATCGAQGDENCCTSIAIPGGSFDRSYDLAGDATSGNTQFPATLSNFRLDKFEVTVGRFRAFVNAGMGTQANPPMTEAGVNGSIADSGWSSSWNASLPANTAGLVAQLKCLSIPTWTDAPAANERRPINCITWYEAMAFCTWDGGFLPTEAQWNYAAAGGDEQRAYPWSSPGSSLTIDSSYASYADGANCLGDGAPACTVTDLIAVGTKPTGNGRWGHADLAGNVFEWTLDWYSAYVTPCKDCANLTTASSKVIRGGGFNNAIQMIRTATRFDFGAGIPPSYEDNVVGVRCARGS